MSSNDAPAPSVGVASPPQHQPSTPGQAAIQPVQQQQIPQEALTCQWTNCGERCPTPEALYDHVCERHVGRKSTNNLNLTCQWGNCRTTTVKRDHITSHIRVHVPLKPHKCDFCGKAFKRPQDLKKHVKTHADDSVLLRSPEPGRANHNGPSGYGGQKPSGYYPDGNSLAPGYAYQHAASNPPGQFPPSAQQNSSYGQVYYTVNNAATLGADYEIRKRAAFDALNEFFGDAKRRLIDPTTYYDVGHRLMALNAVPSILGGYPAGGAAMSEYHPGGGLATATHGGPIPQHHYSLPLPNLRTKSDLLNVDQFLDQLQSTVYESPSHAAAAGVSQPVGHYVSTGMNYGRSSGSPPTSMQTSNGGAQPHSGHATAVANISTAGSTTSETPALTPASSTISYTSGHSPPNSHNISPTSSSRPSEGPIYPTLPSVNAIAGQYAATSSAPASGLASAYDPADGRRRWSGGQLQKVAPSSASSDHSMSPASDITASPKAPADDSRRGSADTITIDKDIREKLALVSPTIHSNANLDPALRSPGQGSEGSDPSDKDERWVENIRCIEALRGFIKLRLDRGEFDDEEGSPSSSSEQPEQKHSPRDTEMGDADAASLYPVLRELQES